MTMIGNEVIPILFVFFLFTNATFVVDLCLNCLGEGILINIHKVPLVVSYLGKNMH